jgi:hypothetical protein
MYLDNPTDRTAIIAILKSFTDANADGFRLCRSGCMTTFRVGKGDWSAVEILHHLAGGRSAATRTAHRAYCTSTLPGAISQVVCACLAERDAEDAAKKIPPTVSRKRTASEPPGAAPPIPPRTLTLAVAAPTRVTPVLSTPVSFVPSLVGATPPHAMRVPAPGSSPPAPQLRVSLTPSSSAGTAVAVTPAAPHPPAAVCFEMPSRNKPFHLPSPEEYGEALAVLDLPFSSYSGHAAEWKTLMMADMHRAGVTAEPPCWALAVPKRGTVRDALVLAAQLRRDKLKAYVCGKWLCVMIDGVTLRYVKRIMICIKVGDFVFLWAMAVMSETVASHPANFGENVIKACNGPVRELIKAGALIAMMSADGANDAQVPADAPHLFGGFLAVFRSSFPPAPPP